MLIGLPEIAAADAAGPIARAREVAAVLDVPFRFDVSLYEGGEAAELLGRY